MNDQDLLRRFEPIVRYTKGEQFFPMDIEPYIRNCSLWMQKPGREAICLVPDGQLTIEKLIELRADGFEAVYFLRFIEEHDLEKLGTKLFKYPLRNIARKKGFRPGRGRLARVGYSSRFIDALFSISLFARGRVPGDTAVGACLEYERIMAEKEHYSYYGRVIHQDGWIVLQYWFFYAFNNWRSGFSGVNDHESDWEMICIYLYENEDKGEVKHPLGYKPEWIAYASHDFHGDDLRRRWDDPEVQKVGEHPIIYTGAGSHASYFSSGEYMTEVVLPFLTPMVRLLDQFQRFWRRVLKQYQPELLQEEHQTTFNLFHVPFIDYARGDGLSIGYQQEKQWDTPRLFTPQLPNSKECWVSHYRGLWGLYTHDPVSGEDAPAGPMYNRNGSVRNAWFDPISWAGLSKVPPPNQVLAQTRARRAEIEAEQTKLNESIAAKRTELIGFSVEAEAMQGLPYLKKQYKSHYKQLITLSAELVNLRDNLAANDILLETLDQYIQRLQAGDRGAMRAHIHHGHHPVPDIEFRYGRLAEVWASISMGLIMIIFVGLFFLAPERMGLGVIILLSVMIFIESTFRKQLQGLVSGLTNMLAVVASLVLLFEFSLPIMMVAVLVMGGYIIWQNLREFLG